MLKDRSLRSIFFVSLAVAILFPLINIFVIYPLFSGLLIKDATENAVKVASHLRPPAESLKSSARIETFFHRRPEEIKKDFSLYKIKVFSASGEVIYSTDPQDVGKTVERSYFHNVVAKGNNFAKLVKKDSPSLESEFVTQDVVETYVPIMENGRFVGAFEVYSNITTSKGRLENTVFLASIIPFSASGSFMLLVLFLLRRACDDVNRRQKVEEELRLHHESLESQIANRTAELEETNSALSRSQQFLSTIFDSIHDPFCIFDRDYRIIKANEAYAQIKDKRPEELENQICYKLLHTTDKVCEQCLVKRTFEAGHPFAKDKKALLPDGSEAWFELYSYPIYDTSGSVTHVVEYTRDITDKKLTELERKRLIDELEQLSRTDALTGVLNRRALSLELKDEFYRSIRYNKPLSLILCDLDNLKDINDNYGHHSGDRALCHFADTLTSLLRQHDIAGRYGGDEFMIILPDTDLKGSAAFAERLRAHIASEPLMLNESNTLKMTLSIGVSSITPSMKALDDIIKPADAALYKSKNSGKNMVTVSRHAANDPLDEQRIIPFD